MMRWMLNTLVGLIIAWPAFAQEDTATYRIVVDFNWVGDDLPANPHWSRLIAFAHGSRYALFEDGNTASSGMALIATNGRVSILEAELTEARRRKRAGAPIVLPGVDDGAAKFEFELGLDAKLNQISFASMLAPSPDWFSGASGVSMRHDDTWVESLSIPLWVWDAGADSGPDFEGPNIDTQPRQSVRLLSHSAFLTSDGLTPIGTATFTRTK